MVRGSPGVRLLRRPVADAQRRLSVWPRRHGAEASDAIPLLYALLVPERVTVGGQRVEVPPTLETLHIPVSSNSCIVAGRRYRFVTQEECLHPNLTVRETLLFAAELQLPAGRARGAGLPDYQITGLPNYYSLYCPLKGILRNPF